VIDCTRKYCYTSELCLNFVDQIILWTECNFTKWGQKCIKESGNHLQRVIKWIFVGQASELGSLVSIFNTIVTFCEASESCYIQCGTCCEQCKLTYLPVGELEYALAAWLLSKWSLRNFPLLLTSTLLFCLLPNHLCCFQFEMSEDAWWVYAAVMLYLFPIYIYVPNCIYIVKIFRSPYFRWLAEDICYLVTHSFFKLCNSHILNFILSWILLRF